LGLGFSNMFATLLNQLDQRMSIRQSNASQISGNRTAWDIPHAQSSPENIKRSDTLFDNSERPVKKNDSKTTPNKMTTMSQIAPLMEQLSSQSDEEEYKNIGQLRRNLNSQLNSEHDPNRSGQKDSGTMEITSSP